MITTFVGLVICGLVGGGLAAVANQVIRTLSAERAASALAAVILASIARRPLP
jgi:hypothetical protein